MKDDMKITEKQIDQISGGNGVYAIPDRKIICPRCKSENVVFDKSVYIPEKGEWTYHFWCLDCTNRFQEKIRALG